MVVVPYQHRTVRSYFAIPDKLKFLVRHSSGSQGCSGLLCADSFVSTRYILAFRCAHASWLLRTHFRAGSIRMMSRARVSDLIRLQKWLPRNRIGKSVAVCHVSEERQQQPLGVQNKIVRQDILQVVSISAYGIMPLRDVLRQIKRTGYAEHVAYRT